MAPAGCALPADLLRAALAAPEPGRRAGLSLALRSRPGDGAKLLDRFFGHAAARPDGPRVTRSRQPPAEHFRTELLRRALGWKDSSGRDGQLSPSAGWRRPGAEPAPAGQTAPFFVGVLDSTQRWVYRGLMALWLAAVAFFWTWWLQSEHVVTTLGIAVNSAMLVWSLLLPTYFFCFLGRMQRPNPDVALPRLRVAIVVTKAPSEPWEVLRGTLRGMLSQELPYPYDVWLADEERNASVRQWCELNGVKLSTRAGREDYHRRTWPRRTKSKEGNLSFFYDHWGYRDYDVVAQLDADHVPASGYLRQVVGPFADPAVGYVAAPSLCDRNAAASWSARGRLYKEAALHGAQQAGSHGWAPTCIGSHYAVRTRALHEIGGLGPELARTSARPSS